MNKLILLTFILIFSGCAMPQPGGMMGKKRPGSSLFGEMAKPAPQSQNFVDEQVEVRTEPPGARIHINDVFVGYSPVNTPVRRMWRGDPRYPLVLDTVKIEALPVAAGQCVQTGIFGQNATKTPPRVNFNMAACSPAPAAPPLENKK